MNIVRCPQAPNGGSKTQNGHYPGKSHFAGRKSATKFVCVSTTVVRHPCENDWWETSPKRKFSIK